MSVRIEGKTEPRIIIKDDDGNRIFIGNQISIESVYFGFEDIEEITLDADHVRALVHQLQSWLDTGSFDASGPQL